MRPEDTLTVAHVTDLLVALVRQGYRAADLVSLLRAGRMRQDVVVDLIAMQRQAKKA